MNKKTETDFYVPEWAKGIIWYQIFPERFYNGDPSNDPRIEDQKNSWPHDLKSPFLIHPWESDWYKLQPYEQQNSLNLSDNLQRRRYGGDLQGIIDKLDYLQELGVGALYLNPVFEAPSSHKYDASTWHHIDPTFGPDPEGDRKIIAGETPHNPETWKWTSADRLFLELVEKLHERGMYVIIDGVFNHMGLNSWVYQDIVKNQQKSPYSEWMKVEQWADEHPDGETVIKTWEGFKELPEIRQDRTGLVDGPKQYVFDITRRWMDPLGNGDTSKGVDGWRLDVAFCIKHPFWKKWRKHVRSINPEAYLLAEVIDTVEKQKPYLKGDEFDAVMNYNFAFALCEFFIRGDKKSLTPGELDEKLRHLRESYPPVVAECMHNLLDSHDTDRVASRIMNSRLFTMRSWGEYYERSKMVNPEYDTSKPTEQARHIQKLMVAFQIMYLGSPVIYYGDEAGLWGPNDPCNRKPMMWPDLSFEDEKVFPNNPGKKPNENGFDQDLFSFYKKLTGLRNSRKALQKGNYQTIITDDKTGVFGFSRKLGNEKVAVVFNNGDDHANAGLKFSDSSKVLLGFHGAELSNGALSLPPLSFIIVAG